MRALPAVALLLAGCASIGNPSGGPRDEDPPVPIHASPGFGAVNVPRDLGRATLVFNENVNVKDAFSKVMVSPSGSAVPRITSNGRKVTVDFPDSLEANTTYTLDFADAIEDNNEGNRLQGFLYSFSTGPVLDSLEISGMVLGALDLEPQQQVLVGVHRAGNDSAFLTKPFERVARTDDLGRFTIAGLSPGEYLVYSLGDLDSDRKYANPEEAIGFLPFTVVPTAERVETTDTIWNLKTASPDTVVSRTRTRFLPNDILLRSFNTRYRPQYLSSYDRPDSTRISLVFNAPNEEMPKLEFPGRPGAEERLTIERSLTNDTLTLWLPRDLASVDTLMLKATHVRPDSLWRPAPFTDELELSVKRLQRPAKPAKVKKGEESPQAPRSFLGISHRGGAEQEVYLPMLLETETPLARLDTLGFRLELKRDTLWLPAPGGLRLSRTDSLNPRGYRVDYPWEYGATYRLSVDSASMEGIYGAVNRKFQEEVTVRKEEDYSTLTFIVNGLEPGEPAFVELLRSGDKPVRSVKVSNGQAFFDYLPAGDYYARLTLDANGNGQWDPGSLPGDGRPGQLPDEAFYYPKRVRVKKNWDVEQTWDVFETAVDLQKPVAIKQNKPKEGGSRNSEEVEEEEPFDPTANPFDPEEEKRRKRARANRLQ